MGIPFSDDELIAMPKEWGTNDGGDSEDDIDGLDDDTLYDIADDAWNFSGWMNFENHPKIEDFVDEMSKKSNALKLSRVYKDAFVVGIKN